MKYLLKDNFEKTQKVVSEKDLRDLYNKLLEDIIFNWQDCKDKEILENLTQEKNNVYNCDIDFVIKTIQEDDKYYEIIKID